jgi:hypothetical protein
VNSCTNSNPHNRSSDPLRSSGPQPNELK